MKATFSFIIGFFILSVSGIAQVIPTIGEIYDFQPGDVFHKVISPPSVPRSVSRITILDRYYSPAGDTVFYPFRNDHYSTSLGYNPPHLEYSFDSHEGIMSFTNLDSLITTTWYTDTSEYNDTL